MAVMSGRWRTFLGSYVLSIAGDRWLDTAVPAVSLLLFGDLQGAALYLWSSGCARPLTSWGAGRWVSRWPAFPWLGGSNLLTGIAMAGLGLVFMSGGPVSMVRVGVIVAGILLGVAAGVQTVVFGATVKAVVPASWMGRAQAQLEIADSLTSFVAPLLATWMLLSWQPGLALVVAGSLYLLVAALRWRYVIVASVRSRPRPRGRRGLSWFLVPFEGRERRHVSVAVLTASLLTMLCVPVASARLEILGLSPGLSGMVIAATSLGSIPAALVAGRLIPRMDASRLVLVVPLLGTLVLLVGLHFSSSLPLTLALAAGFDACACWVFVVTGTARTQGEEALDLVRIAAVMSVLGAAVSTLAGVMLLGATDLSGQVAVLAGCLLCVAACGLSAHPLTSLRPSEPDLPGG